MSQENFPDPFVLTVGSSYYGFSTEAGFLGLLNVPVIRSSDLTNWLWAGPPASGQNGARKDAMPVLAPWVTFGKNWAPSVMFNATAGKYVMYYTALSKAAGTSGRQCIGVATSNAPDGPYVDNSSTPFTCPGSGDVIDPSTYFDGTTLWLLYTTPSGIEARPLAANGLSLTGSATQILSPNQSWEAGRVEAPSMFQTATTGILLLYSGNNFNVSGYAVGAVPCSSPTSCTHPIPSPPILTNSTGPGGQSPFTLSDGTTWKLAYHAWTGGVGTGLRTLHIGSMTFNGSSPVITTP